MGWGRRGKRLRNWSEFTQMSKQDTEAKKANM
jgi:hypothetical protein